MKHYYYQDDARRAKEYQTEIYGLNGNLFSKNIRDYNYTYANGIYNLSLRSSTDYLYDTWPEVTDANGKAVIQLPSDWPKDKEWVVYVSRSGIGLYSHYDGTFFLSDKLSATVVQTIS